MHINFYVGMIPEILNEVKMNKMDYQTCQAALYGLEVQPDNMICFGHEAGIVESCHVSEAFVLQCKFLIWITIVNTSISIAQSFWHTHEMW